MRSRLTLGRLLGRGQIACACGVLVCFGLELAAGTLGYWRFETSSGFTTDSSGNGNSLTIFSSSVVGLPSAGRGLDFPNPVPQTGEANLEAAQFITNSSLRHAAFAGPLAGTFTAEAVVHWETSADSGESFGDVIMQTPFMYWQIRTDGYGGSDASGELVCTLVASGGATVFNKSGFNTSTGLGKDTDYYFAVRFDETSPTMEFLVKNLTTNGPLQAFTVPNTVTSLATLPGNLTIGNADIGFYTVFDFSGLLDEVRISDEILPDADLLITQAGCETCTSLQSVVLAALCANPLPTALQDFKDAVTTIVQDTVGSNICADEPGGGSEANCEAYLIGLVLSEINCQIFESVLAP